MQHNSEKWMQMAEDWRGLLLVDKLPSLSVMNRRRHSVVPNVSGLPLRLRSIPFQSGGPHEAPLPRRTPPSQVRTALDVTVVTLSRVFYFSLLLIINPVPQLLLHVKTNAVSTCKRDDQAFPGAFLGRA